MLPQVGLVVQIALPALDLRLGFASARASAREVGRQAAQRHRRSNNNEVDVFYNPRAPALLRAVASSRGLLVRVAGVAAGDAREGSP